MTQKEIKDRLRRELPAPYGELAAANVTLENKYNWAGIQDYTKIADVLMWAFWWDKSNESGEYYSNLYWAMVYDSLVDGERDKKLEDIVGAFPWAGYRVKAWKNIVCIGCQTITRAEVELAQSRKNFIHEDEMEVSFNDEGIRYGALEISFEELNELFAKLDELGF